MTSQSEKSHFLHNRIQTTAVKRELHLNSVRQPKSSFRISGTVHAVQGLSNSFPQFRSLSLQGDPAKRKGKDNYWRAQERFTSGRQF